MAKKRKHVLHFVEVDHHQKRCPHFAIWDRFQSIAIKEKLNRNKLFIQNSSSQIRGRSGEALNCQLTLETGVFQVLTCLYATLQ